MACLYVVLAHREDFLELLRCAHLRTTDPARLNHAPTASQNMKMLRKQWIRALRTQAKRSRGG